MENIQTIAFASNVDLDVRHVTIHEALNDLFQVSVMAVSSDDSFDLDAVVAVHSVPIVDGGTP